MGDETSADRRAPKRAKVSLSELTHIVRPPGNPAAIHVYTREELTEAQRYADSAGTAVAPLDGA